MENILQAAVSRLAMTEIAILDLKTGEVAEFAETIAREKINSDQFIETVPLDPRRGAEWIAALRARIIPLANANDIPAFEEYEKWCSQRGLHALPVKQENLTLYLLGLAANGVPDYVQRDRARSVARIHMLTGHPPRHLEPAASNACARAISFAKIRLNNLNDTENAAARAIVMFPGGNVPKVIDAG